LHQRAHPHMSMRNYNLNCRLRRLR
jgi:hypothetical protein